MHLPQYLAIAQMHVHAARHARIEAAHRAHDVDALESIRRVLLEYRGVLHRVFKRPGRAVTVSHAGVPGGRRVRVVVGDPAAAYHHVMAENTAYRFGEAAAIGLVRDRERLPGLRAAGPDLGECLLNEVDRAG